VLSGEFTEEKLEETGMTKTEFFFTVEEDIEHNSSMFVLLRVSVLS